MQELIKTQLAAVSALWLLKHHTGFCGAGRSLWAWHCLPQHPACPYPSKITVESKHGGTGNCLKDPLVFRTYFSSLRKRGVTLSHPLGEHFHIARVGC